jgi:hypothetical protein
MMKARKWRPSTKSPRSLRPLRCKDLAFHGIEWSDRLSLHLGHRLTMTGHPGPSVGGTLCPANGMSHVIIVCSNAEIATRHSESGVHANGLYTSHLIFVVRYSGCLQSWPHQKPRVSPGSGWRWVCAHQLSSVTQLTSAGFISSTVGTSLRY